MTMKLSSVILLLLWFSAGASASTAPYGWDTVPELAERATAIVELSGAVIEARDGICVRLQGTVVSRLKGDDPAVGAVVVAAYPDYHEFIERCAINQPCLPLTGAMLFLVTGNETTCPGESRAVLFVMEPPAPGEVDRIALTRSYLAAPNKLEWAKSVRLETTDDYALRSAIAATLPFESGNVAVSEFLSDVALDPRLSDRSRLESVKVLSATESPAETTVIEQLHESNAPTQLKRDVIPFLDRSEETRHYLKKLTGDDVLGWDADVLLRRQYPDWTITFPGGSRVSVGRFSSIKEQQLINVLRAGLSRGQKMEAARKILDTIPKNLWEELLASVTKETVIPSQSDILKTLTKENIHEP